MDYICKEKNGNPKKDSIPTADLMTQGIMKTKSKPIWVFMKKVAKFDTERFISAAL